MWMNVDTLTKQQQSWLSKQQKQTELDICNFKKPLRRGAFFYEDGNFLDEVEHNWIDVCKQRRDIPK
jgi:hypothetical protein